MDTSRELYAALTWWRGAHAYSRLAQTTLRRAGVEPLTDPRVIALALGYSVVPIMSFDERWRAELCGRTIRARWRSEHAEDRLNVFCGLALASLRETGNECPTETQRWGMTVALALPDDDADLWELTPHVPRWLVDRRIAATRGDDSSGVRPAILKR